MTTQTSQAAAPAVGFPNTMSDIIDSLKRLERIGDESSKTVEKIIKAAEDLEKKIASQYRRSNSAMIRGFEILNKLATFDGESLEDIAKSIGLDAKRVGNMYYWIEGSDPLEVHFGSDGMRVSKNRETALRFASDVANGLLVLIQHDLQQRHEEESRALKIFSDALPDHAEEDSVF